PLMGRRIVGIELYGPLELLLGTIPVPLVMEFYKGQRAVCFGKSLLYLKCLHRRRPRLREGLFGAEHPVFIEQCIGVCQARVGQSVARIFFYSPLEILYSLFQSFSS